MLSASSLPHAASPLSIITIIVSIIVTYIILFIHKLWKMYQRKKSPPIPSYPHFVPNPHWFLGHSPYLASPVEGAAILCKKYASPSGISTYWTMGTPTATSLNADHVAKVFQRNPDRNAVPFLRRHYMRVLGRTSLILARDKVWAKGRNLLMRSLNKNVLRDMQPGTNLVARRCIKSIRSTISTSSPLVMNMNELARMITIDIFGVAGLGHEFGCTKDGLRQHEIAMAFEFLASETTRRAFVNQLSLASQLYWLPTARNRRHAREMKIIKDFVRNIISNKQLELDKLLLTNKKRDCLMTQDLLGHILLHSSEKFSHDYLSDFFITILYASYDTSSVAIPMMLYALALNPTAQRRCVAEVRSVLSRNPDVVDPVNTLPYCRAVMLEALRLYPPGSVIPKGIERRTELGDGLVLDKGIRFTAFLYWVHRNPQNFYRAEEFLPERWVRWDADNCRWIRRTTTEDDEDDDEKKQNKTTHDDDYIPPGDMKKHLAFSTGPRSCAGYGMAMTEGITVLAYLLRDLKFEVVEGFELEWIRNGPISSPKGGMQMIITEREEKGKDDDCD